MQLTNFIRENIFLLPFFIAFIITLIGILELQPKPVILDKYNALDKPFDNEWSNKLYEWSYKTPFSSFVPEDARSKQAIADNDLIAKAGLSSKLDYRTLSTMQILLSFAAVVITIILSVIVIAGGPIFSVLLNLEGAQTDVNKQLVTGIFVVMLLLALAPKMWMKSRAKKNALGFVEDLPELQMFVVLMIRSRRSISEIIYTLSVSGMRYKDIFATAYRIYLRNKDAAFDYLMDVFGNTGFKDSVAVLASFDEYSREDTANVLHSRIDDLLEDVESIKKDKSVAKGLFSEGSVAFPFIAIFCLGVFPLVVYAMNLMNTAQQLAS